MQHGTLAIFMWAFGGYIGHAPTNTGLPLRKDTKIDDTFLVGKSGACQGAPIY